MNEQSILIKNLSEFIDFQVRKYEHYAEETDGYNYVSAKAHLDMLATLIAFLQQNGYSIKIEGDKDD